MSSVTVAAAEHSAYGRPARVLHWLLAVLIVGVVIGGIVMVKLESGPLQNTIFNAHRSLGFVVLVLALARLAYRATHAPKPLPDSIPAIQRFAAETVHWGLYGLMITVPLLGWVGTNAFGAPIPIFGLFELPVLVGKDEAMSKMLLGAHVLVAFAFVAGIALHVGAALFHTIVKKDGVIWRMWPI